MNTITLPWSEEAESELLKASKIVITIGDRVSVFKGDEELPELADQIEQGLRNPVEVIKSLAGDTKGCIIRLEDDYGAQLFLVPYGGEK